MRGERVDQGEGGLVRGHLVLVPRAGEADAERAGCGVEVRHDVCVGGGMCDGGEDGTWRR